MTKPTPKPMCFVAMPFGKKSPPGKKKLVIDFDRVYEAIQTALAPFELEVERADRETIDGFIHKPMFERLLIAEFVVADLTFSNPNVAYEVGIRHGASAGTTILLCAASFVDELPFDFRPLRIVTYELSKKGKIRADAAADLGRAIGARMKEALAGDAAVDNPIMQITGWAPEGRLEHEKTDVFLGRLDSVGEIGREIDAALRETSADRRIAALRDIEDRILGGTAVVAQLHSALLGIYIGYRENKAYGEMVRLFDLLPTELRRSPVTLEQLALALNRLAEQKEQENDGAGAHQLRQEALARLDDVPEERRTSETFGIHGRIHKALASAREAAGDELGAKAELATAIERYEEGFRSDVRDYYPGVNAVTLRLVRGDPEDARALETLVPAVRFSVQSAPEPLDPEERYWQRATRLELAGAAHDWADAQRQLEKMAAIDIPAWMWETTAANIDRQRQACERRGDSDAAAKAAELRDALADRARKAT